MTVINFTQSFKMLDGTDVKLPDGKVATLKFFACEVLQMSFQDEQNLPAQDKCKRWLLATRIYANPEKIDLEAEDIAELKKLIGKAYGPLVVAQALAMLEGK